MSDQTPTSSPDDPHEALITAALKARADTAVVAPDAWSRFEQARTSSGRMAGWRTRSPFLAAAAVVLVLLAVAALATAGTERAERLETEQGSHSRGTGPGAVATEGTEAGTVPGTTTVPPTSVVPPASSLGDLRNATYPRTLCPDDRLLPPGSTVKLVDGEAVVARVGAGGSAAHVSLDQSIQTDLDGDGHDEAVARFACGYAQSDAVDQFVAVLRAGEGGRIDVAATLTASGTNPKVTVTAPNDPRSEEVTETQRPMEERPADVAAVDGHRVRVRWYQDGGMAESELGAFTATVIYRWDGRGLVTDTVGERKVETPRTQKPLGYYAIRKAGIRSMTMPLAPGRDERTRVCADFFSPPAPLADVKLVDGRADVPGAGAAGLSGSVSVRDVVYGGITGADPEDTLVTVECRFSGTGPFPGPYPGNVIYQALVVRLVDGRPTVIDVVAPPSPGYWVFPVASNTITFDHVTLSWVNSLSTAGRVDRTYRWDGRHLVPV